MLIRDKESSLPNESALTLLLVLLVLTFILTTIWPREDSCTMHLVTMPLAFVLSAISPSVVTNPFYTVVDKVSMIACTIPPQKQSSSILLPEYVLALIR